MTQDWLELRIKDRAPQSRTGPVKIAIPKRVVRLSTRRNRIRRLIREVTRLDPRFDDGRKEYTFYVRTQPDKPGLGMVRSAVLKLMEK